MDLVRGSSPSAQERILIHKVEVSIRLFLTLRSLSQTEVKLRSLSQTEVSFSSRHDFSAQIHESHPHFLLDQSFNCPIRPPLRSMNRTLTFCSISHSSVPFAGRPSPNSNSVIFRRHMNSIPKRPQRPMIARQKHQTHGNRPLD